MSAADRDRALVFGKEADAYERFRPGFPDNLMNVVATLGHSVLDVGSGTGKAAAALRKRGCDVLAVEPDSRMAEIARSKGVTVEDGTFEEWDPRGRTFDTVVFARSWHWVDPTAGIEKLASIVSSGGHIALLANDSTWRPFDRPEVRAVIDDVVTLGSSRRRLDWDATVEMFSAAGYDVHIEEFPTTDFVTTTRWLDTIFTFSTFLQLDNHTVTRLRGQLADAIGSGPVDVGGTPRAMIAKKL